MDNNSQKQIIENLQYYELTNYLITYVKILINNIKKNGPQTLIDYDDGNTNIHQRIDILETLKIEPIIQELELRKQKLILNTRKIEMIMESNLALKKNQDSGLTEKGNENNGQEESFDIRQPTQFFHRDQPNYQQLNQQNRNQPQQHQLKKTSNYRLILLEEDYLVLLDALYYFSSILGTQEMTMSSTIMQKQQIVELMRQQKLDQLASRFEKVELQLRRVKCDNN